MRVKIAALIIILVASPACGPRVPRSNVIIITLDTLRADHLGAWGYSDGRTPELDRLAAESFVFTDATSPVPLTLPAHTSILTGLYPPAHGVRDNTTYTASGSLRTLAEVLRGRGYHTAAIIASCVLNSKFGLNQGFEYYHDRLSNETDSTSFHFREIDAAEVTDRAIRWLEAGKKPFFLWLHYFDPHADYTPPEPFRSEFSRVPSDGEVAYLDSQFKRLFAYLRGKKLLAGTLTVITSDHGEGLGDHDEPTHGIFVYQSSLHVPLIFKHPAIKPGRSSELVSLVDIFPTVLAFLSLPPDREVQGSDLTPVFKGKEVAKRSLYFETLAPSLNLGWSPLRGIRTPEYKYIDAPRRELYDVEKDPGEEDNRAEKEPLVIKKAAVKLRQLEEKIKLFSAPSGRGPSLNTRDWEALQSLGYGGGGNKDASVTKKDPKTMVKFLPLLARSESCLRQGKLKEAEVTLKKILAEDPLNPVAWERLVVVYRQTNSPRKALDALDKVIKFNPGRPQPYLIKATILRGESDIESAWKTVETALNHDPRDAQLWILKGKLSRDKGDLEGAYRAFKKALDLHPEEIPAIINLADYYYRKKDWKSAEENLKLTIKLEPDNPQWRENLGLFFYKRKQYKKAVQLFQAALRLNPDQAVSRRKMDEIKAGGSQLYSVGK